MSGAGRIVTHRSLAALAARSTTAATSRRARSFWPRPHPLVAPPASVRRRHTVSDPDARRCSTPGTPTRARSTRPTFRERPGLQRGQGVRHLLHQRPREPEMGLPRTGESWRANATSEAKPRPRLAFGTPAASSAARRLAAHNAVARACPAAAADFIRSNSSTLARSAASPASGSISNKLSNTKPTLHRTPVMSQDIGDSSASGHR